MKKLNNKGFSLVELIIVIAIMAILVGVVGSQVIPYLENSRKAKDQQVLSAWNTAAMSAYSNAAAKINSSADYTISITANDPCTFTISNGTNTVANSALATTTYEDLKSIGNYFKELTNIDAFNKSSFESNAGKDISSVVIEIKSTGAQTLTVTNANAAKYSFDKIENK